MVVRVRCDDMYASAHGFDVREPEVSAYGNARADRWLVTFTLARDFASSVREMHERCQTRLYSLDETLAIRAGHRNLAGANERISWMITTGLAETAAKPKTMQTRHTVDSCQYEREIFTYTI